MHVDITDIGTFKYFEELNPIEIKKYFQQYKELKLIIVIIPTSPGTIYSKHIVFFSIVF